MKKFLSLFTFLVLLVCFSANAQEKAGAVLVNKDFTTCTPAPVPAPAGDPSPITLPSGWSYIQSPRRLQVAAPIATQYYNYFAPTIVNYQNETFLGITQQGLVITPAEAVSYQQLEVQVVAKVQGAGDAVSKLFFGTTSTPAYGQMNVVGNTWKTYIYHYVQLSTGNITMGMIEEGGFSKETLSNVWVKSLLVKKPDIEWPESVWATDIEKNTCTAHCEEVNDATSYEWVIGTPGFDPDGSSYAVKITSNTPSKAVTGLTENTAYEIYARAKNSSYTSHWSPKSTFKTNGDCSYYQNFNGCEDQPITPDAPNIGLVGWTRYNNYDTNAGENGNKGTRMSPSLANNGRYTVSSSDEKGNALKFYFSVSTASKSTHTGYFTKYTDQYAILPARSYAKLAQVTFKYRYSSSVHHSEFYVGVMVSPTDPNSFTPLATIASHSQSSAYVNKTVNLASYQGEGQYIAFKVPYPAKDASGNNVRPSSTQSGAWQIFIDDVGVEWKVKRPSITSVTSSQVTWTSQGLGEKGKYELVLSPTALTPEQLEDPEAYGATIHEFPQNTLKWTGTICPGTY